MTRTTPLRLIILHLSHILLTLVRTFMIVPPPPVGTGLSKNERHREDPAGEWATVAEGEPPD